MRPVVYQLFVRHFANFKTGGVPWGTREQNGCGTFNAITDTALEAIARMGITHIWLTGVLRHATRTEYPGLPPSPACVVKGIAGSPYAVTDYFDVDPDLATDVEHRLDEFRALLERCRRWGMVPMMDFIPNHVSRCYHSTVRPDLEFGNDDDTSRFFAFDNTFYYLEPCNSDKAMMLPDGEFEPERGHGRVTGNNAASWAPGACDWYETVKLNYGTDYRHGASFANALPGIMATGTSVPRTWRLMDAVLRYWQGLGVGGFRCDMAHMVPMPFWRWAIAKARLRDDTVLFLAEGYNDHMKLTEGDVHSELLQAGFDGVYDGAAYEALRGLYESGTWANDLEKLNRPESPRFNGGVRYIENHDEPRVASPKYWGGMGRRVFEALMVAQYTSTAAPVLIYNGQEVAERAEGPGGFGGDNGRTSIFDYTCLPRLQHWSNGGLYDGGEMTVGEAALRDFTVRLLPWLQHPAFCCGSFYGLNWANHQSPGYGRENGENTSGHRLYAFLRHARKARATLLIVCNFAPDHEYVTRVHIPRDAQNWAAKKPGTYRFCNLMEAEMPPIICDDKELDSEGLPVSVPAGKALILEWD